MNGQHKPQKPHLRELALAGILLVLLIVTRF